MSAHTQDVILALLCALGVVVIAGWLILTATPKVKPVRPCRKCAGHGWVVSAGWARTPYQTCDRCNGRRVES